ncbi:glycosylphosphatidylinositol-alpha 1,2 mannosyltransferase NDAI_0C01290 [Naumovozyma dairenensis CBS 421]|uniref:Mannosyltransferase n=1 Tax=Naumovozyma dairenensis (strain ATCC 10597 / BCRC 20456 / CBS 421 / NBRC 0211 / NRRL Y-12639) TaxID=1071378 RepID=G0W7M9_NAUDC|nr:hypothetical protein NDAI_0C01290 [Naumovozyma dairenensis CBS 421]CCD23790.1 hypothetical protein NDAI_0C01290 [Naumovozyma dairenensis CBS 421]
MLYRPLQYFLYLIGIIIALQPSYIHPDEHFQSLEILTIRFFNIKGTIPWEFQSINPARSFVPLYLFYGPLFYFLKHAIDVHKNPLIILYSSRLYTYIIYIITLKFYLKNNNNTKKNRKLGFIIILSSYVTWTYQSHTFSNSTETIILLLVLSLYEKILSEHHTTTNNTRLSILLGCLISIGTFNRMTFGSFILLPSLKLFIQFYSKKANWKYLLYLITSFTIVSFLSIQIDSILYHDNYTLTVDPTKWIITPLNNIKYNLNESNLSLHGLHSRYTHLLINLPQIIGPLFLIFPYIIIKTWKSLSTLSIVSTLLILSSFKHQELRFLIPLTPLIITSVIISIKDLHIIRSTKVKKLIVIQWIIFNLIMGIIVGIFHQSGIIPIMMENSRANSTSREIWWKTYSPPTWLYMNPNLQVINDKNNYHVSELDKTHDYVFDMKGCDVEILYDTIETILQDQNDADTVIKVIIPKGVENEFLTLNGTIYIEETNVYSWRHLDLDHGITFGLSVFNVTRN